jgi:AcrR family transcriptional regulator
MVVDRPRDRILAVAARLFHEEGITVTGVDRIVAEAKVAPMTLYRHFGSKDALVAAALERWSVQWLKWLSGGLDRSRHTPRARLVALWDMLERWTSDAEIHGSFIANTAVELRAEPDHPAQVVIASHRRAVRELLEDIATEAGVQDPVGLAAKLQLLLDGTAALSAGVGPAAPPGTVRSFASAAVAAHTSS